MKYYLPTLLQRRVFMDDIYSSVANLGFPIVISIYLLVRIEGKLNELTKSITELAQAISR